MGKAMRAVAQDRDTARLMGINVDLVISMTFLIGAGMGGAAGTLFSVQYGSISPYSGFILGMKAFTAAVFGGIGKIPGAMLGGILLGLTRCSRVLPGRALPRLVRLPIKGRARLRILT
jgi:branched-chain amino acid transport system permease protein